MRAKVSLLCLDRVGVVLLSARVSGIFNVQQRNSRVDDLNGGGFRIVCREKIEQCRRVGDGKVEVLVH